MHEFDVHEFDAHFTDKFFEFFKATEMNPQSEGGLEAPTRHPIDWKNPAFYDQAALFDELTRVFDLCHGCRRCVSLCEAFPTLFDLVDASQTLEIDGVARDDYWRVVDQCYLCDLCYQTKCPYIPPHEWNIDFPHLMLRAKAVKFRQNKVRLSEKILASTDAVGKLAGIPIVVNAVNAANKNKPARKLLNYALGVDPRARVPAYHADTLQKRRAKQLKQREPDAAETIDIDSDIYPSELVMQSPRRPSDVDNDAAHEERIIRHTTGKVALFATCYANYNEPQLGEDLIKVLEHNGVQVELPSSLRCCGMPKLELGDLESVERAMRANLSILESFVERGFDVIAPVPSCVLMFRQELPLLFAENSTVRAVGEAFFDPFEYLMVRHRDGLLNTDFAQPLGKIAYHVACHQRVQKIGLQTKQCLQLVPDTEVRVIERCSGHDGTYGVKARFFDAAGKIARPVVRQINEANADHYCSDCPMAGRFLQHQRADGSETAHPISLLRRAYEI